MTDRTFSLEMSESQKNSFFSQNTDDANNTPAVFKSTISYELIEKIGEGGMGEVYKARLITSIGTSEIVAIKKIRSDLFTLSCEDTRNRIKKAIETEISIVSELNGHTNIVGFRGADYLRIEGEQEQCIFFVMEYVQGFNLNRLMDLHHMSEPEMIAGKAFLLKNEFVGFILYRIANALDYAHTFHFSDGKIGIAHLDLSPANILINDEQGWLKLTDFGLATSMDELISNKDSTNIIGKPFYMSPELISNTPADFTVDIYSLGVIAYQLMTGICPNAVPNFGSIPVQDRRKVISEFQQRELVPPHKIVKGVNEELSNIVLSMMDEKKENRFSNVKKLREVVGKIIYEQGYGPTDSAFAKYLAQLQLFCYLREDRDAGNDFVKKRDYDKKIVHLLEMLKVEMESLRFYPDALKKYALGVNPCRL